MARVSRKKKKVAPLLGCYVLKIGLYVRLSNENNGGMTDISVKTQLAYLKRFVKKLENVRIVDVFIDNGQTGTNFNRPEWQRLMEAARRKEINCIVVKDLSRFARSYIDAGDYLERIFPELGVRLIAINDSYDSYNILFPEKDILASFRNLANDYYSKDISRKVLSAFETKKNKGEYIGSKAPYGYVLIDNHFVVDPPAAAVVKRIFDMRMAGMSFGKIARQLNEEGVASPSRYAGEHGYRKYKNGRVILWQAQAVSRIVYNQTYAGDLIVGKFNKSIYSNVPNGKLKKEQWKIIENAHERIVEREIFQIINETGEKNRKEWQESQETAVSHENVLKDILVCGNCGHKIHRHKSTKKGKPKYYYSCDSGQRYADVECCPFSIVEHKVHELILQQIRIQIELAIEMETFLLKIKEDCLMSRENRDRKEALGRIQGDLNRYLYLKSGIYEDMRNGVLTQEEYLILKEKYAERIKQLQKEYEEKDKELKEYKTYISSENRWVQAFLGFRDANILTREMAGTLLEKVELYDDRRIHIIFKFRDDYEHLSSGLERKVKAYGVSGI